MTHFHDASDVVRAFVAAFNARESGLLRRTYAGDAVVVPAPGQPMTGADRVAAIERLLSFGLPMAATVRHTYVAGDIALLIVDWSIGGTLSGTATDVVRRDPAGGWQYLIDNPFGTSRITWPG
jgi:ketosteroid isomerase-like protein